MRRFSVKDVVLFVLTIVFELPVSYLVLHYGLPVFRGQASREDMADAATAGVLLILVLVAIFKLAAGLKRERGKNAGDAAIYYASALVFVVLAWQVMEIFSAAGDITAGTAWQVPMLVHIVWLTVFTIPVVLHWAAPNKQ